MSGFYNYDTRGVSQAGQIVNLERMVEERDAEIDRLRAEVAKLRKALSDIVRRYEFRSELYIDDATCAGTLYDTARLALAAQEGGR